MGKLGKNARKFAKKNLQSVQKRNRKTIANFKWKRPSKGKGAVKGDAVKGDAVKGDVKVEAEKILSNARHTEEVAIEDPSVDPFSEDGSDSVEDSSDSDGSLPEDSSCAYATGSDSENESERSGRSALFEQNQEIQMELAKQKRKLDQLKKKDLEFAKFLDGHNTDQQFGNEENYSDGEGEIDQGMIEAEKDGDDLNKIKVLTASTIDSWCELIMAQNVSAFPNLLNAYRDACYYGSDNDLNAVSCQRIHSSATFCKIIMFVLKEADGIFRKVLGISSSNCKMETVMDLKNTPKWKTLKGFINSYLRSTLFLLSQVTDSEILVFALSQLRACIIFFAAFPSLQRRLIKVAVHLWATGGGAVSSSSFLILRNMALLLGPSCHGTCLIKTYKTFIAHCKIVDSSNLEHLQFLVDSLVELYSLDISQSFGKALVSIQQLAKILQLGLKTKNKEALKKIYNWQYINCVDLWVKFISTNIKDHDLQPLLYLIIQVINGVAHLFPGTRYFPLRLKCIQMLNQLSSSSGFFIPITSLALDSLEFIGGGKPDVRPRRIFDVSSVLKVPKQLLKSQYFQEELVLSAIKLVAVHFSQWSLHISFPEVATIPLTRLRKFHEKITAEHIRRPVKRLIDQVEQNIEFVQKKRDEVDFSPKDQESVESFFQLHMGSGNFPFAQYYASVIQKSLPGDVPKKPSAIKQNKVSRKRQRQNHNKTRML